MTTNKGSVQITKGMPVLFRDDFSADLVGILFEVDNPEVRWAAEGGYAFIGIRTRVGKAKRWGYRLAKCSDLRTPDGRALVI